MTQVFFSPKGDNKNDGAETSPKLDLEGFAWPKDGAVTFYVRAGHTIGDIVVPAGIEEFTFSAYRWESRLAMIEGQRRLVQQVKLPKLRAPWPEVQWAGFGNLAATCACHLHHFRFANIDITVKGVLGSTEEEDTHVHVTMQHGAGTGDIDISGSEMPVFVPQFVTTGGAIKASGIKGRGRLHLQATECDEIDVDGCEVETILGHTDVDPNSPTYEQELDSCKYRRIKGAMKAGKEAMLKPYGTGKQKGALDPKKGEKPEYQKAQPVGELPAKGL